MQNYVLDIKTAAGMLNSKVATDSLTDSLLLYRDMGCP